MWHPFFEKIVGSWDLLRGVGLQAPSLTLFKRSGRELMTFFTLGLAWSWFGVNHKLGGSC